MNKEVSPTERKEPTASIEEYGIKSEFSCNFQEDSQFYEHNCEAGPSVTNELNYYEIKEEYSEITIHDHVIKEEYCKIEQEECGPMLEDDVYGALNNEEQLERKSHLAKHLKKNCNEKLFKCNFCSQPFNVKSSLNMHLRKMHSIEKPFECDVCGESFKYISNLTEHLRVHSDQTPFKCNLCNNSYRSNSSLNRHSKVHTGEAPYKCDVCSKSFRQNSQLMQHLNVHSDEKTYKCSLCSKLFNFKASLYRHLKNIHYLDINTVFKKCKT